METNRGPKDFQYDQVFTPEHGQEKVFEDTNVSQDCFVLVCLFVIFFKREVHVLPQTENSCKKIKRKI